MPTDKSFSNNLNIKYKSVASLFSRIKEQFSSYDNSGLLDEGTWYSDIKYILSILGTSTYKYREEFLDVENYKVKLPSDFYLLDYALIVDKTEFDSNNPEDVHLLTKFNFDTIERTQDFHIYDGCDPCCIQPPETCVFNSYEKIYVSRKGLKPSIFSKPRLMKPGNVDTRAFCYEGYKSNNNNSDITFSINNGYFYVNFNKGSVYIAYHALPIDDETGLPLIPDSVRIEKVIESYIKLRVIEKLIVNKESDLVNLLPYYKQEYKEDLADAKFYEKLPSFSDMVQATRRIRKNQNFYNIK